MFYHPKIISRSDSFRFLYTQWRRKEKTWTRSLASASLWVGIGISIRLNRILFAFLFPQWWGLDDLNRSTVVRTSREGRLQFTFWTNSSKAICTPSRVRADASMKSIACLRANRAPSSRVTSRWSSRSILFPTNIFTTSPLVENVSNSDIHLNQAEGRKGVVALRSFNADLTGPIVEMNHDCKHRRRE